MDLTERERLRQRLNFPQPAGDTPVHVPSTTSSVDAPWGELPVDDAEPIEPTEPTAVESPVEQRAELDILSRLAEIIERLDDRIEGNRVELERINERLDNLELVLHESKLGGDDLVGIEAVRRTVAASHRALASQLIRMIEDVEARVQPPARPAEVR